MSLPPLYLSRPGVSFPATRVDNAEVIRRVRERYKGPESEWPTLQAAIEHVFGLCKTRDRYFEMGDGRVADYAVAAAKQCLEINGASLDEVDLLFPRPHGIVVHPAGDFVYVASLGTNQIASVGVDQGEVRLLNVVGMAKGFVHAAVSPDGSMLAVTAELTDSLLVFDLANPSVPKLARGLPMPDGPFESAFTPDGRSIFVTALNANRVAVVDTRDWSVRVLPEHAGFGQPHGIALSPDGSRVFVGNRHQFGGVHDHSGGRPAGTGTVVAICVESRNVDTVLSVGRYAAGLGMTPARPGVAAAPRPCR